MLATTRERRANAGSKMAELLESEDVIDDFYKEQYGGFVEVGWTPGCRFGFVSLKVTVFLRFESP